MSTAVMTSYHRLTSADVATMRAMLVMFGEAFGEMDVYTGSPPSADYLQHLLGSASFIAVAALKGEQVVGGLVAYELPKFEQERSEIYIYDLAVAAPDRRQGIASALIARVQEIAANRGAHIVFVQADRGDAPAVALYSKLGKREDVLHFDVPVRLPPR